MRNRFYLNLLLISVLLVGVISCKPKQMLTVTPAQTTSADANIQSALEVQPHFITANANKLKMDISLKNKELSSSGACRIYRDSVIQLSIQPFMGIEMVKIELTPDAMYVFDQMSKNYYHLVYEQLAELTGVPLSFYDFQALVSNQLFTLGSEKDENFDKITTEKLGKSLMFKYKTNDILQTTTFSENQIRRVEITDENKTFRFFTNYSDFAKNDDVVAPKIIDIQFINSKNTIKLKFKIEKIEFNRQMRIMLTNPMRFKAGNWQDFLNNPPF
ncbi:MAG: DUF4292 domain-containing protein [Paludibacter sp.]|nr:DUF4292 domain-containing protein [Paludibacter sp.]